MNSLFSPEEKVRWKPIHVAEVCFLLIGICCLGWVGWNWAATEVDQRWSEYELNAARRGAKPTVWGYVTGSGDKSAPETPEPESKTRARSVPPPPAPKVGATIGRVEMPRLRISAIVKYGSDDKTLKRAVGLVPGTALPGQPGNVGIAAHRDTFFRNLRGVKVGDVVRMTTSEGTWDYEVESTKIVRPKNVEVLDPTPHPAITLVTCYPFNYVGHAPKRFIVRAKQVTPLTDQQTAARQASPSEAAPEATRPAAATKKKSRSRSARLQRS